MAAKLQMYSEIADYQTRNVTSSTAQWKNFLTTASRLYKYSFNHQLMIFAQRPDAVACAELETWNKPMHRYVKRGSKGIAIIDESGRNPRLRYIFDYSDTADGRYNARQLYIWQVREEHENIGTARILCGIRKQS